MALSLIQQTRIRQGRRQPTVVRGLLLMIGRLAPYRGLSGHGAAGHDNEGKWYHGRPEWVDLRATTSPPCSRGQVSSLGDHPSWSRRKTCIGQPDSTCLSHVRDVL